MINKSKINHMRNYHFLFVAFLCQITALANWAEVSTPTSEKLNKLEIIGNIAFCVGENGTLLKSTNFGDTWNLLNSGTSSTITSIKFVTANLGFFTTIDGEIFKTQNGGSSWTGIKLQVLGALNCVDFLDENTGLTAGDNGNIFRTINGGATWDSLGSQSVFVINDILLMNDTLALNVGALGSLMSSSDLGLTWMPVSTASPESFSALEKKTNEVAVFTGTNGVIGEFSAISMSVGEIKSIDSENDWLKDLEVLENGRVFAVGRNSSILRTNNGWKTLDLNSINHIQSIKFFNKTLGLICGLNGKIYKTETAGAPVASKTILVERLKFHPNPANNFITLSGNFESTKLEVFDISGKNLMNINITSNNIDISNLVQGQYFLRISSSTKIYSGKLIVR